MKVEVTKLLNQALGEVIWKLGAESEWDAKEVETIASDVVWGHCGVLG